jgi:Leucine-rich repeat (LRR) protein
MLFKTRAIRGLDYVAKTLKQLWISYNEIERLEPLKNLIYLEVLYIGNNSIAKIDELNNLVRVSLYSPD